jgi:hypothetical protein
MTRLRHIYVILSFATLIGIYRYLMMRFYLSDLPVILSTLVFGVYLGAISRDWFKSVSLPYKDFEDITLGYAMTTHKAQGVTVKNSFILCGGSMSDREISYVQASRAKQETSFFTEKITRWNPQTECREDRTLQELSRQMSESRQKDMAHDVAAKQEPLRATDPSLEPSYS